MKDKNLSSPGLFAIFKSVLAAFFGVQSEKNRERDFVQGKFWHFALMGVVATLIFILLVWGAVNLALTSA